MPDSFLLHQLLYKTRRYSRWLVAVIGIATCSIARADTALWRIGSPDNANTEFSTAAPPSGSAPATFTVPVASSQFPNGFNNGTDIHIRYTLSAVPQYGVMFKVKIIEGAPYSWPSAWVPGGNTFVPELSVWSNADLAGIVQAIGADPPNWNSSYWNPWAKTYEVYIPREMLIAGTNDLRIQSLGHPYSGYANQTYLYGCWDYLELDSLASPSAEPVNGKVSYMGAEFSNNGFASDDALLQEFPYMVKWPGIAYSGNPFRLGYFQDVSGSQPDRLEMAQMVKAYNMTGIMDGLNCRGRLNSDGSFPSADQSYITSLFNNYAGLFQYYELCNEPCEPFTNADYNYTLDVARIANGIRGNNASSQADYVKIAEPGWAYGGGSGNPTNWDQTIANRQAFQPYTQATNGHAYGMSYTQTSGNFLEDLASYAPITDGWGRDMINTEFGCHDADNDFNNLGEQQLESGLFDRIVRAHLAFCDYACNYATTGDDATLSLFANGYSSTWPATPSSLAAYVTPNNTQTGAAEDTRLKIFRRNALAYCTHGAPLPYTFTNSGLVANQLVYFRAVNTAGMGQLPASHATSSKILLNFVNFDTQNAHTIGVQVTLPSSGVYWGERFGPGTTYASSESQVQFTANPTVTISETVPAGDSVQYILDNSPSYVVNPGFEAGIGCNPLGWYTNQGDNSSSGVCYVEGGGRSGNRLTFWAPYSYSAKALQLVTGIPNGTYTLTTWVKGSGGQSAC